MFNAIFLIVGSLRLLAAPSQSMRTFLQRCAVALLLGCVDGSVGSPLAVDFRDADDFWFGLATAPAHAEDNLQDAWIQFAHQGNVRAWQNTPNADQRLRFWTDPEVDIKLAANTGVGVYRLGVDWGRLVPGCELSRVTPCGVQAAA